MPNRLFFTAVSLIAFSSSAAAEVAPPSGISRIYDEVVSIPAIHELLQDLSTQRLRHADHVRGLNVDTEKFQHFYKGLEVIGSMALHHRGPNGKQIDDHLAHFDLDTTPELTSREVLALAFSRGENSKPLSKPKLKIFPHSEDNSARLVFVTQFEANQWIIDAHNGETVAIISNHEDLAGIQTFSAKGTGKQVLEASFDELGWFTKKEQESSECQLIDQTTGAPFFIAPQYCAPLASTQSDPAALRAQKAAQTVLQYYQSTFSRNSYDNRGSPIVGVVHAGLNFDNAYWNTETEMIAYGDGDGVVFKDFTQSLDVIAHEITHGVTSTTAKLLMIGESGSLNEAFSDFFGRVIALSDEEARGVNTPIDEQWIIGKSLFMDPNSPGVRNLAEPSSISFQTQNEQGNTTHAGVFPSLLSEKVKVIEGEQCDPKANDNCFCHINSTIPGHAEYLVYQAIGRERAEHLYFTVLTQKMTETSTFQTAAQATVDTCKLMYDAATCAQVTTAYAQTGFTVSSASPSTTQWLINENWPL